MLFQVGYLSTMKWSVMYEGLHSIDFMLVWHTLSTIVTFAVARYNGYNLCVEKEVRFVLYMRSLIGVLAHMAMIYGVAMVPLVCH